MSVTSSTIKLSSLNGHLICGLCGGYLIDATVLSDCIHVFCRSCILKYLIDHKVCPLCQSLIQETRPGHTLRPDVVLQRVVYKLVPGLLQTEMRRLSEFRTSCGIPAFNNLSSISSSDAHPPTKPCLGKVFDFCGPPLPTALATRSLSRSPSTLSLASPLSGDRFSAFNRVPPSVAYLIDENELISISLTYSASNMEPLPDVFSCCQLDIMTTKACATASLVNMHCCPRCVLRLLHGDSISSCRNVVINAKDAIRESPICPFCCGLLHHPSLCTLTEDCVPSGGIPNVLHSIVAKLRCSEYEFSACQIKVADPLALVIRDEIMLGVVLQSADSDVGQSTTECQVPSLKRDVKFSGQSKLPAKVVWRWIIESQLSSTLKVPFISSLQDLDSIQGHNLTFLATNSLLVIEIELAHSQSEQEGQLILEHACLAGPASIRAQALGLLNAKSKSKRTRYQRRTGHDDTSRPSTPSDELLSACRFSKTKLQLLFSALSNCASKMQFSLPSPTTIPYLADLKLGRLAPVILAGRYVKLSRRLPQTPWIVDNVRKLPSSVEELIVLPMKEVFGQSSIFTFTASGREDVDVRCLGLGRPFILKIENYEASIEKVICLYSEKHGNRGSKLDVTLSPSTDNQTLSNIDLLSLATLVNSRAGNKLFIRDLQVVRCSDDCHAVKRGELEKPKCYMAVCWCPQGGLDIQYIERMRAYCNHQNSAFPTVPISYPSDSTHTWGLTKTLWQFGPITLVQRTPIRALHRRSALERVRSVHLLRLLDYRAFMCNVPLELDDYLSWSNVYPAEELFIIDLRCDAGTYVKEFIHGDLGRTRPSLASIFQCQVDILALDVVSIELDWPPRLDDPKFLP